MILALAQKNALPWQMQQLQHKATMRVTLLMLQVTQYMLPSCVESVSQRRMSTMRRTVLRTLGHVAMTVKVRVGLWRLRRSKTALLKEKLPSIAAADARVAWYSWSRHELEMKGIMSMVPLIAPH